MKACIDIGGTKVAVSLATGQGMALVHRRTEPTATTGGNDALGDFFFFERLGITLAFGLIGAARPRQRNRILSRTELFASWLELPGSLLPTGGL